ncbi:MAG: hypothetical protein ACJ72O_11235 [Marmoricola sp.]
MPDPDAPPLSMLPAPPPIEPEQAKVPAQASANGAESSGSPKDLPPGTTSIRVTSGQVEYVTADGKKKVQTASKSAPVEVTLGVPVGAAGQKALADDLIRAQRKIVRNISGALTASMSRIESAYILNLIMNLTVFGIGLIAFVLAALKGLDNPSQSDAIVSATFGGLSAITFLAFFVSRPLAAVASSGAKMAWLLATVNTYWTKLIYINKNTTVLADLQRAQEQFEASMQLYMQGVNEDSSAETETHDEDVEEESDPETAKDSAGGAS